MSVDCLTYGEETYFKTDPSYRRAVYDFLREFNLPLRLASLGQEDGTISLDIKLKNMMHGSASGRGKRKIKWRFIKKRR